MATAVNEKIQNVLVIEDETNITKKGLGSLHLLTYPMDIQDAEEWEDFLSDRRIAYALVQCEMRMQGKYRRGYCLFTRDAVEVT